jgi:hypothetical protein
MNAANTDSSAPVTRALVEPASWWAIFAPSGSTMAPRRKDDANATAPAAKTPRFPRGMTIARTRHRVLVSFAVWWGIPATKQTTTAITAARTKKFRCSGKGAYWVRAPIDPARPSLPGALNSTMATLAGLRDRPTPRPMNARPAMSQGTPSANAKRSTPTSSANRPSSMADRRPMWSDRSLKMIRTGISAIGYAAKIQVTVVVETCQSAW